MVTRDAHNVENDGSIPSPATVTLNVVFDNHTQGNELKLPIKKKVRSYVGLFMTRFSTQILRSRNVIK